MLVAILFTIYPQIGKSDELLEQYKTLFENQQREFEKQRQIIIKQGKEIDKLKTRLDQFTNQPPAQSSPKVVDQKKPRPTASSPAVAQPAKHDSKQKPQKTANLPAGPVGQAPPKKDEKPRPPEMPRLSDTVGGVLTRKGKIVLEPGLEYAYNSNSRVFLNAYTFLPAIAIGLIDLRKIDQHSLMASVAARYGVTDRFEVEARIPFRARFDEQRSRPINLGSGYDEIYNTHGYGLGDLEFSARYQLNSGANGWPIFVGNLVATTPTGKGPFDIDYIQTEIEGYPSPIFYPTDVPTGSGFFSFEPSVTALYPTDPAVFFANLAYNYNLGEKVRMDGSDEKLKVEPGDGIGMTVGMGFGINERSSFNIGYSHRHIFNTRIDKRNIKGSNTDIGQLLIGYAFKYSPQTTLNFSFAIGTTSDAQDVRLNFRMPMSF